MTFELMWRGVLLEATLLFAVSKLLTQYLSTFAKCRNYAKSYASMSRASLVEQIPENAHLTLASKCVTGVTFH